MNKDDIVKLIDGIPFYRYEYADFLYQKLEEKGKEIDRLNNELEEYKKDYDRIYTENCRLREKHNITDISLLDENYRLNNIMNELHNLSCQLDSEIMKRNYVNANRVNSLIRKIIKEMKD